MKCQQTLVHPFVFIVYDNPTLPVGLMGVTFVMDRCMKQCKFFWVGVLALILTSCASWFGSDEEKNPFEGMTAKQLMAEATNLLAKDQYKSAAKRLEAMETMYPFSDYAEKAQLDLIYAYYKDEEYPAASATAERFIHLYPRAKRVDYAYYMKALANFQQTRGTFARILPLDESWRDPGTQAQAYSDFATLIQKFPESQYRADSLRRMTYLRNTLAQRELNTSEYYYVRKMYVASAERASYLLKTYEQAPSAKRALQLLYLSNRALGLTQAAHDAAAVYEATYHQKLN